MRCTYCGSPFGETMDHVLPHSFQARRGQQRDYSRDKVVPACQECNSLLGNRLHVSIGARAGHLIAALTKRYRAVLRMPAWPEDDLSEISDGLADNVRANLALKKTVSARIQHCEEVWAEAPSLAEVWARIDAEAESNLIKIA